MKNSMHEINNKLDTNRKKDQYDLKTIAIETTQI